MMPSLSERMRTILGLLKPGLPVWDLCCDHGYMGWGAWETGRFPEVHFVDQVPSIIEKLQSYLPPNSSHIYFHAKKAEALDWASVTRGNLILSGVGAYTTINILQAIQPRPDLHVFVSPQKDPQRVREWLCSSDWRLQHDLVLKERGRYRQILHLGHRGAVVHPFGNQLWDNSVAGREYHAWLLDFYQTRPQQSQREIQSLLEIIQA